MRKKRKLPSSRFVERKNQRQINEVNITIKKSRLAEYGTLLSGLATIGLFGLAVWTAFFSDFSKIIEENLRRQNSELKQEKDELALEVNSLEIEKFDLKAQISSSSQKLTDLKLDVERKQKQAANLNKEVLGKNKLIDSLSSEKNNLSEQTQELETDLVEKQIALFLAQLPTNRKYSNYPKYLSAMIFGDIDESFRDAIHSYAELAYTDMENWLADMNIEATTAPQKKAAKFIQEGFQDKCGSRSKWVNLVSSVDLSELEYIEVERKLIAEKLSKITNKQDRRTAEVLDFSNEANRNKAELEFYFQHLPESVSKCFKF